MSILLSQKRKPEDGVPEARIVQISTTKQAAWIRANMSQHVRALIATRHESTFGSFDTHQQLAAFALKTKFTPAYFRDLKYALARADKRRAW